MAERHTYRVSELIEEVNTRLWGTWGGVAVEGEVSNLTRASSGHTYFSIKDERAQLRIVLFAMYARGLGFRIENGLKVIVRGKLSIYEQRGEFQLNATAVEPAGLGALQLAFEQLKAKLSAEGLFDSARKKAIPALPQRIAVVTSPTGAALRDILHVLARRHQGLSIQIYPVRVQGQMAAKEIAAALHNLSRWKMHDVVLICRGGGSLEDLWPFNEEVVARAVAGCSIPTISGVGHEVDFTICDFVADLRAPTPSAAAEIVIRAKADLSMQVSETVRRIRTVVERQLRHYQQELRHLASSDGLGRALRQVEERRRRLERDRLQLYRLLERQAKVLRSRLSAATEPLARFPARMALSRRRDYLALVEHRVSGAMHGRIIRERHRLGGKVATLQAVSPLSVLSRGYAIAFVFKGKKRRPLMDSAEVQVGEAIEVQLRKGRVECTVDGKTLGVETIWPEVEK
jgi:exodeoxyribonuclease VII large subunit